MFEVFDHYGWTYVWARLVFVTQLLILMEMTDGVESGRECKAAGQAGAGLARTLDLYLSS